jgi:hypothetical protein
VPNCLSICEGLSWSEVGVHVELVWIERRYFRQRAQVTFGGLTPIEFEG